MLTGVEVRAAIADVARFVGWGILGDAPTSSFVKENLHEATTSEEFNQILSEPFGEATEGAPEEP